MDKLRDTDEDAIQRYATFYRQHEVQSKRRIVDLQEELDKLARQQELDWTVLRNKIELQTKIEELIIKWRQAEHDKWQVYGPLIISAIGVLVILVQLGNFILALLNFRQHP